MRAFGKRTTAKQWARFALKCGLILTDAKLWAAIDEELRERADNVSDVVRRRYEDTADRLQEARRALHGDSDWLARTTSFLGGLGIGLGLGMLFAPLSGEESHAVLRDKAVEVKNKVGDVAAGAARVRTSATRASTGTTGD